MTYEDADIVENPLTHFSPVHYQQLWSQGAEIALAYAAKFGAKVGEYENNPQEANVQQIVADVPVKIMIDNRRMYAGMYTLDESEIQSILKQLKDRKDYQDSNNSKVDKSNNADKGISDEDKPTEEELKDYLRVNNVKFHHKSKYETLYNLYLGHKG